jgi:hypothetical protein
MIAEMSESAIGQLKEGVEKKWIEQIIHHMLKSQTPQNTKKLKKGQEPLQQKKNWHIVDICR